ncbi:ral GTPase-activating protein subunit beta isoform X2 [Anthonomus grandis grandis]|uniref:ral GTPase-activating protein subunit beta isoform X2 n=1 Tax=Anthonomus grandis grandis TaxID=2921223 RepID=UPI00216644E0|nr:ral GTPase-activating protein subunit beta isoform X2 [Anthonomus grandis grandis]
MNLGLFNRMNLKESSENKGMYAEWTSLSLAVQEGEQEGQSVLEKFDLSVSKEITLGLVKQLASNLGIAQAAEPSILTTDREVQWSMEVLCFGLSLPLAEHEAIKDCVNVYCEWLTALLPEPKICVPKPIISDPNVYSRKIVSHLHYLFVPRKGEGPDIIHRQAVLCHRVLRTLQEITHKSKILDKDTWEALLLFLLAINDILLAPPTVKDDVADQLCERVLSVLFEVWLIACAECFPSPPLWKTLRECCMNWRHRVALIEQWNRVNLALTSKVLSFMYGPNFPELKIGEELIPRGMSNDSIAQSWYRFLNTVGNPVSLTKPEVISQTQKFLQFAISTESVMDPCQHPCLQLLPVIFLKAIKGVAGQVDAFLGIAQRSGAIWWDTMVMGTSTEKSRWESPPPPPSSSANHPSPTPPVQRRLAKSFSVTQSSVAKGMPKSSLVGLTTSRTSAVPSTTPTSGPTSSTSTTSLCSFGSEARVPLAPGRPKCNIILHLFGEWLFDAAFIGCDLNSQHSRQSSGSCKRPSSVVIESGKSSLSYSQPSSITDTDIPPNLTIDKYESGKAEALGTLCRIFCAKKTGEEILPVYLARFYLAITLGLKSGNKSKECGECMVAILINSQSIFSLDLDGVRTLIPAYISALEIVLPDKDLKLNGNINKVELRRAAINLLLSILVLPLHFQNCPIKELYSGGSLDKPVSFSILKPKLMNLLMNALQVEYDPQNTHMLLGGLFLCVQDSALYETAEHVTQSVTGENPGNLLSSASDTASTISMASSDRSITPDQRSIDSHDAPLDSAHALFVRATYLVCHRLISSWKTDLNVSLAALELLSGLARIHIKESDAMECKRAVKWLCDYIVYQCSRPPPAHSKDLHSTIVAAFHCCSVWLCEHPYLLKDKDCLTTVLEVSELGVSGSKSVGKPNEPIKMKEEKELKPASMRVRDAAENLLTCILEQVAYFPNQCGPESISSLLNETSLLRQCSSSNATYNDLSNAVEKFRYFVTEGSVMLALLEEPLGNDQDPQPTVTLLIRGPFGRHAWTMQLRHLPRHKSGTKSYSSNACRPVAMEDTPTRAQVKQKYFPDSVDRVQQCQVDQSIPTLESLLENNSPLREETNLISQLINRQSTVEANLYKMQNHQPEECVPPPVCHEFQTARLFLSHFGLLALDEEDNPHTTPNLVALDSSPTEFCKDLQILDQMSPRTCDTVHIFYVKSQQNNAESIVGNSLNPNSISPYFFEFIHTLGWPVCVDKHPGWTGHVTTSWKLTGDSEKENVSERAQNQKNYDGSQHVLYWADACSEIAFVVPSKVKHADPLGKFNSGSLSSWNEHSSWSDSASSKRSPELDSKPVAPKRGNKSNIHPETNTKIMIVWLESFEDHLNLPIEELLDSMSTGLEKAPSKPSDVSIIYLQFLTTGLFKIHLQGPTGRVSLASPLIDGMIVSRRSLGSLVRHTCLNMARRKRLDLDNYQPPHVRRRLKIQEIVQKYKREMTKPELLTYLFSST